MMRLRLGILVIDFADTFHIFHISKTTDADTFLDVLDIKISPFIIWPERPVANVNANVFQK